VINFRRRGGALLLGLATGTVLVGSVAVAAPAEIVPAGWQIALGAGTATPTAASTTTSPTRRTTAVLAAAVPTTTSAPATTVAPPTTAPQTTTTPPPPTTTSTPDAAHVRATRPATAPASSPTAAVIAATNKERREAGCKDLEADPRLTRAAQSHASDMAENGYFSHSSEDGTRFDDRIRAEGHSSPGGENIAKGQTSSAQVVREWMNSRPHRRNIEDCTFTTIGVGHDGSGNYWVQDFGT
jgi:uncharacterized protein YkwD